MLLEYQTYDTGTSSFFLYANTNHFIAYNLVMKGVLEKQFVDGFMTFLIRIASEDILVEYLEAYLEVEQKNLPERTI